jgi:hypothetical protein
MIELLGLNPMILIFPAEAQLEAAAGLHGEQAARRRRRISKSRLTRQYLLCVITLLVLRREERDLMRCRIRQVSFGCLLWGCEGHIAEGGVKYRASLTVILFNL